MPYSSKDARDLLISSVLYPGPVVYIDDRWLYDEDQDTGHPELLDLEKLFQILSRMAMILLSCLVVILQN